MPSLFDNHGRKINYLRLAVTDRCNLRCFYCMPEHGIEYLPKDHLLTYEEIVRLVSLLAGMGIEKVRITGGEPFVRKDIMELFRALSRIEGIKQINLTTNGTIAGKWLPELKELGISSVNLSLDTLDPKRFHQITRRDDFENVMATFHQLIKLGIPTKINSVLMQGKNEEDLEGLVNLTRDYPVSVRFIEEMPFNGEGAKYADLHWNHIRILEAIKAIYPDLQKVPDPPFSTSSNYFIPGHQGNVGIIAAYSRTFCGTCNRIRLTAQGTIKTCLYDDGVFNIRDLMRNGATDEQIKQAFLDALNNRARNGFEAEARRLGLPASESMATIGG
ncbi:MAG: GTP 3',8-cyclase MoaA [Saprospiraceae bacterium]|jgi:cyclic pyranopterin phosphate synthase|nr:MAG: GTP 3',8-cyclase MoaA [Bacteroidota bacterium]